MEESLSTSDVAEVRPARQQDASLRIDTAAASAPAPASAASSDPPLSSPAERTEASHLRELRTAGGFGASADDDQTDSSADNSWGSAAGPQQHRRQRGVPQQYGGTPTSAAALAPSSSSLQHQQQPPPQQAQWTVEEGGVRVSVTAQQAADGAVTLTLPSGAVVTLQAAALAPAVQPPPTFRGPIAAPGPAAGGEAGRRDGSIGGGDRGGVPFVPSLNTSIDTGSRSGATTAAAAGGGDDCGASVRYIDPMSGRIRVGGGGSGGNGWDGKVSAAAAAEEEILPSVSNVDSADAAAGDGSPQKKREGNPNDDTNMDATMEQVAVLRRPNSSVIISASREGSVADAGDGGEGERAALELAVEVLHRTLSVSTGSNTNASRSQSNSNGSKSLASKHSGSSDPDLAAGIRPQAQPKVDENMDVDVPHKGAAAAAAAAAAAGGSIDEKEEDTAPAPSQAKPAAAPPPKEEYKPLWLKAREEGREEEAAAADPSKVYFVMNKQSNRKTEYYVSSGKKLQQQPGGLSPDQDSAETDKPPSQIAMEDNLRRAQQEAAEAAALRQQQLEELAYLREMQRRHADLEGQYIYHDADDMTEVSELTMGVHELGIGPSIAHTSANAEAEAVAVDDLPDIKGGQYSQSVDWNNLSEEQKKQISSDMASRNGGAVGLPDNERFVETVANMLTPELCHKAEPTRRIVRSLGALQPMHSTRSINMYQHNRVGRGGRVRGGVYRPAAAAASSAQLPSINDVDVPASPRSNGPTSSGGSTGETTSSGSQRKIAKPVSPLKSLKSIRGLHGGIN